MHLFLYGELDLDGSNRINTDEEIPLNFNKLTENHNRSIRGNEEAELHEQLITYRIHVFKYIIYEMFVSQLCQMLNKRLCTEHFIK